MKILFGIFVGVAALLQTGNRHVQTFDDFSSGEYSELSYPIANGVIVRLTPVEGPFLVVNQNGRSGTGTRIDSAFLNANRLGARGVVMQFTSEGPFHPPQAIGMDLRMDCTIGSPQPSAPQAECFDFDGQSIFTIGGVLGMPCKPASRYLVRIPEGVEVGWCVLSNGLFDNLVVEQ